MSDLASIYKTSHRHKIIKSKSLTRSHEIRCLTSILIVFQVRRRHNHRVVTNQVSLMANHQCLVRDETCNGLSIVRVAKEDGARDLAYHAVGEGEEDLCGVVYKLCALAVS